MRLKDKVAIVTGSGSGFGEGIAQRFTEEGAKVVVAEINVEHGVKVAGKLQSGLFVEIDVRSNASVKTCVEKTLETPTIKTKPSLVQLTTASKNFDGSRAWEHLRQQVSCGPRPAGSVALAVCRNYIVQQLRSLGILVEEQPFTESVITQV